LIHVRSDNEIHTTRRRAYGRGYLTAAWPND
jgi:hypothetical protein